MDKQPEDFGEEKDSKKRKGRTPAGLPHEGRVIHCGDTRRDSEGNLEWQDPVTKEWKPAVYHEDIRQELLDEASNNGEHSYARERAAGRGSDVTAFVSSMANYGGDPAHWPPILRQIQATLNQNRTPSRGYWYRNGRLIINHLNEALRDFPDMALAYSTEIEGWAIESIRRSNLAIQTRDIQARMTGREGVYIPASNSLNMRAKRFRSEHGLVAWHSRQGTMDAWRFLKEKISSEQLETNDIGTDGGLDNEDKVTMRDLNKGKRGERSRWTEDMNGKRVLKAVKRKADREAWEADGGEPEPTPEKPTVRRRHRLNPKTRRPEISADGDPEPAPKRRRGRPRLNIERPRFESPYENGHPENSLEEDRQNLRNEQEVQQAPDGPCYYGRELPSMYAPYLVMDADGLVWPSSIDPSTVSIPAVAPPSVPSHPIARDPLLTQAPDEGNPQYRAHREVITLLLAPTRAALALWYDGHLEVATNPNASYDEQWAEMNAVYQQNFSPNPAAGDSPLELPRVLRVMMDSLSNSGVGSEARFEGNRVEMGTLLTTLSAPPISLRAAQLLSSHDPGLEGWKDIQYTINHYLPGLRDLLSPANR